MYLTANPMVVLNILQQTLEAGASNDPYKLEEDYESFFDEPNGRKRFSIAKIANGEAQAIAIFENISLTADEVCYSIRYAVKEKYTNSGLALPLVTCGLEKLKEESKKEGLKSFFLETVVDENNSSFLRTAKSLFQEEGRTIRDGESAMLKFRKFIEI